MKDKIFGPALLATMAAFIGPSTAMADPAAVARAEEQVKKCEQEKGPDNSFLRFHLQYLANAYHYNGEREKAEQTYQRLLQVVKKQPGGEQEVPAIMTNWALMLSGTHVVKSGLSKETQQELHQLDLARASQIRKEALALYMKLPLTDAGRLNAQVQNIGQLMSTGDFGGAQAAENQLLKTLESISGTLNSTADICRVAAAYDGLAEAHSQYGGHQSGDGVKVERRGMNLANDFRSTNYWGNKLADQDFQMARKFKLTAIALYDRLPATERPRIEANRSLIFWYRSFGKSGEATAQTEVLAKLLGSNAPEVLFPPPRCPACGMG